MHHFEVWAPLAHKLALKLNDASLPMDGPDENGLWQIDAQDAGPGSDYGFLIDDDPTPYPDPRSAWQPNGVHKLSRVYDHTAYTWHDTHFQASPLASAIIYELHPGTFTTAGTLDSAIARLDYLVELGITHVELMPVAAFDGNHGWGYDGVHLFAVQQGYGGPDALKRFVDAAHQRGLAVLLDVVYNHFGPVGNYAGKFAPYLVDTHHTPWGGAVNFEDWGSLHVRRFICDNALMWMRDYHIDGLRLDAIHAFVDRSATHILEQLSSEVETLSATLGRRLVLIAESDLNDPRVVIPREANGYGMDAQWSDDFHHALVTVLNPNEAGGYYEDFGSIEQLARSLEQVFVYDGLYSKYRNRHHGRPVGNLSRHRFLGFIQNHDQVGNRAIGDRLAQVVGLDRAKIGAALLLTSPFVPMLFQGEEWAASTPFQYFADHEDTELARAVSEGRRREFAAFGWDPNQIPDPEKRETFERSFLNWDELTQPEHAGMLHWYKALIRLRRSTPALNNGEPGQTRVTYNEAGLWMFIQREDVFIGCNLGTVKQSFELASPSVLLLSSRPEANVKETSAVLPTNTLAIWTRNIQK